MKSLHLLSLLLQYPSLELQTVAVEIGRRLASDTALSEAAVAALDPLLTRLATSDIYDAQETYVELFDRGRAHSLHLFEHVHGESRDRGQAMVDLRERYLAAGLEPTGNELPDYLPLFLDYCSTLPDDAAREMLAEPGVVLVALAARLAEKQSDYAPLFVLLCDIAGVEMDEEAKNALPPADDPEDLEALDAQWEEEEIRFGAEAAPDPNAACPKVGEMLDQMRDPPASQATARS
ncbi:nitrate reductase molybdenum cofactor assembly chaperone [Aurantiacibacter sp. D1-12]|uniref:nitrate reductase molybdenum cofactor assembly chaperone n=1 Tax=Aurantiacibacter sp. D1-12 TaxID=2993658 RepID=UPI00237CC53A|nr:nitrate reductase molybdenum cofactor assembly chaperone [Aurantiacibacter sp. D1-12]MDE1467524.1 nitrate reductase molybdenum cofactor assembly chaperone [Aurantiacibacter sp. D1-12]